MLAAVSDETPKKKPRGAAPLAGRRGLVSWR